MAWTVPKTWTAGEVVGETDMNTHVRDNLTFLKSPSFSQTITGGGTLSTTATTAVPLSTADLSITLTTYGGAIQVFMGGTFSALGRFLLNLDIDGTAFYDTSTGIIFADTMGNRPISYHVWVTGLASGSHTFYPTWRTTNGNTALLNMNVGLATFWAREG